MIKKLTSLRPVWTRETAHNKFYALLLICLGLIPIAIDYDGTALLIFIIIGLPLFFAKENLID